MRSGCLVFIRLKCVSEDEPHRVESVGSEKFVLAELAGAFGGLRRAEGLEARFPDTTRLYKGTTRLYKQAV
jgi:hypothetical protein